MAAARLLFLGQLVGRRRLATKARRALADTPRTEIELLEAWNDFFLAAAAASEGVTDAGTFERSLEVFERLGVPAGARFARLGQLWCALLEKAADRVRRIVADVERNSGATSHRILALLEPLAAAESSYFLGDIDRATQNADRAVVGMVGQPFLELEWRLEFLRARIAERRGDRKAARHHLHRATQTRDFFVRALPGDWRDDFLALPRVVALETARSRLERRPATRTTPPGAGRYCGLVGRSLVMRRIFDFIEGVREVDLPVFVHGRTGTGKELVARALHQTGPRRDGRFYSLHCASLPPELFESELFGYEAGAFTGADESRAGILEYLEGGTILLDELTLLSLDTQTKLLQVLDAGVVRPLGGTSVRPIDVRFLASSSADPAVAVEEGSLREDLFYRLRGLDVRLPSLEERAEDIPHLVRHFLELHGQRLERVPPTPSSAAAEYLANQSWRGNVRELESVVLRLLFEVPPGASMSVEDVMKVKPPGGSRSLFPDEVFAGRDLKELKTELERGYLARLFRESGGSIKAMTETLGVQRSNLYTWFRRVGLDVQELRRML